MKTPDSDHFTLTHAALPLPTVHTAVYVTLGLQ